jgi:hypothetical protein
MAARVQRFNPEAGTYVLLDVASGMVLQERPGVRGPGKPLGSPFADVGEIEPMERPRLSARQTDPLGDYRGARTLSISRSKARRWSTTP